ncbi:phospho-sugar mutase [Flavobacteriaceae bacterium F08102]|nr:phospho-sugar mutase [Flavobacteriaceae bacterium F08102]
MNKEEILSKATSWLEEPYDHETQQAVRELIQADGDELKDSFYKDIAFGTGGMRGIMGPGTNRINKYTLGKATQGLSNYLHNTFPGKALKVAIAYDCRHNSKAFAATVADVLSANGIEALVFDDLRTTPELSFTVRHLQCDAGIVLTASHNPPEYNGYKVYWNDGGQIVPPHDKNIIEEVNKLHVKDIKFNGQPSLIKSIGKEVDQAFVQACVKNGTFDIPNKNNLTIVFTPLHGTSIMSIPEVLKKAGYKNVHIVKEQRKPDGDFPTVASPNPEEPEALKMAMELAEKVKADIVIGTDPDSDRLGIAVRDLQQKLVLLNGNQTMAVMTNFLLNERYQTGKLDGTQFIGTTIVSTNLVNEIAKSFNVESKVVLTGFKWIAKLIKDAEGKQEFIGGGEESFGYMVGDFIRDKDAVTSTLLACEIALDAKNNNGSFYQELIKLYKKHHYYKEHLISLVKKGADGAAQIDQMMKAFRNSPLRTLDKSPVIFVYDYLTSVCTNLRTGVQCAIELPKSNVLIYETEDGTRLAVRPSGTEPKIKFYFSVQLQLEKTEDAMRIERLLDQKIERIIKDLKLN